MQRELETHDAKEKGEGSWWSHGAQQHDEKAVREERIWQAVRVLGLASKVQSTAFMAAPGSGPSLLEVSGCCAGKLSMGSQGAAARRKAMREERMQQAVRVVPGLASKVQLRHLRRHQDQAHLPVFGCWNCRAKMWRGQQAALRAFASARQWCVHGVSRILAMTSTSEIRLAGRQRVLAQSICSKSAFTECA